MKPVVIAGAGPAGLSAAIHLRHSDIPVVVFEGRKAVGARFIGEWQILENYSSKEDVFHELHSMGIEPSFDYVPAKWADLIDDRNRKRRVLSHVPYGYFLKRGNESGTLDRSLKSQAEALGAVVHCGRKIAPEDADIVATGPGPADGIAKEIAFRTNSRDRIEVIFDPNLAPGGYAYFFVLNGWGTLGLALLSGYGKLEGQFEKAITRFQAIESFDVEAVRPGYSYMNFFLHKSSEQSGSVFVGEAGGFQDYLFGLGIRYAIVSGHLAARSFVENVTFDQLWQERFLGSMQSSVSSRLLYESFGKFGLRFFVWQSTRSDFTMFLHKWSRSSWLRRVVRPLAEKFFGNADSCAHKVECRWCRPRTGRLGEPEVLPSDFVARYLKES